MTNNQQYCSTQEEIEGEFGAEGRRQVASKQEQRRLAFFASGSIPVYHRELHGTLSSVTCRSFDVSNVLRGMLDKESACLKGKMLNYLLLKYVDPHVERTSLQPQVPNGDVQELPRVPEMNVGTGCILGMKIRARNASERRSTFYRLRPQLRTRLQTWDACKVPACHRPVYILQALPDDTEKSEGYLITGVIYCPGG